MKISYIFLLGAAVVTALAAWRLQERLIEPEVAVTPPLPVEVVRVTPRPMVVTANYSGSIEADRRATLSARLNSVVTAINVAEGERVEAGAVLLELDDREPRNEQLRLQAASERIQADLEYWQGQLERDRTLHKSGTLSEQKLQQSQRQVASLRAALQENRHALDSARNRLGYTLIPAPFSGVIQAIRIEEGEVVSPGVPLLELVDTDSYRAMFKAPQTDRGQLMEGLNTYMQLHHQASGWKGVIAHIYPALDPGSRNLTLEVPLKQAAPTQLQDGMSIRAVVELERRERAIAVPQHALQMRNGSEGVFVVRDDRAVWLPVKTGRIQADRIELTSGLEPGEWLITTPHPGLETGKSVRVSGKSG